MLVLVLVLVFVFGLVFGFGLVLGGVVPGHDAPGSFAGTHPL